MTVPLHNDDPQIVHTMEPGATYGARLNDLARNEGTYTFHARARYGHGCQANSGGHVVGLRRLWN